MPEVEPVTLRVKDGKLRRGTFSISCRWQTTVPVPINLPLDAPPIEILRLRFKYPLDGLAGSGWLAKLGELEQDVRKKIKKAAGLLMPYGISENEIARLYDEALRKRS
jgi:hypothetical protein